MRLAAPPPLLLLLLLAAARASESATHDTLLDADQNSTTLVAVTLHNDTIQDGIANGTLLESDDEQEPVVRKKRTFGDIVFRGLADVLGYNVQRKPPPAAFPPPVAPVPGIDIPLQAAPAPAPAAPAAAPPPCGAPRAAAPPPCRAQRPPPPPPPKPTQPPCPRPRAAPRPKPRPRPPPPPPPCPQPRANPTTPSPCAPAPPKQQADPNLETISTNFQWNFNFVRSTAAPAAQTASAAAEATDDYDQRPIAPIAIEPRAARLPPPRQRQPRVYVDAFVVRNGVTQRVDTVDAKALDPQRAAVDDDYLGYDEETNETDADDDYEDVQESRDRAVKEFGNAVGRFWEKKKKQAKEPLPDDHYQTVHFGDRELTNQIRRKGGRESHQSLQRGNSKKNTIHLPLPEADDEAEVTTTTVDPRIPLKPKVLPPTEHYPGQIDTVTVRVPPIYKEKRPRKLHREKPERDEEDSREAVEIEDKPRYHESEDAEGDDSVPVYRTEQPLKRRRRRKQNRKVRSAKESEQSDDIDVFSAGDFDYYGKKLPISKEEEFFRGLTIPPPTKDADLARIEQGTEDEKEHFLNDHERLREDPEKIDDSGSSDSSDRSDDNNDDEDVRQTNENQSTERIREDSERSDKLSPNAKITETGYRNNYLRAKNVQVEDSRPRADGRVVT